MDPVAKALWFIESHLCQEITLDEIAAVGGVSRFHLSRAFGEATGRSVMRHVRGRRLSEAARSLAAGAGDILAVALAAGYGSHEAFTRAFREQFGLTPEAVRARRHLDNLPLVETIAMDAPIPPELASPRLEAGRPLLVAGLMQRFTYETCAAVPGLWQRFVPHLGHVPGQVGRTTYGVRSNADDAGFDYLAGVEVAGFDGLPSDLARLRIPARRYAVFTHHGHVAAIRQTHQAIWSRWLPASGREVADAPDFERYDERFDPHAGSGPVEIWIPLRG